MAQRIILQNLNFANIPLLRANSTNLIIAKISHYTVSYVLNVMVSLFPCPLFPQDTVATGFCVDATRDNRDVMTFSPSSLVVTLMIVAFAARPFPLRLPSWSWIRSSTPEMYSALYHSWMFEPMVLQVKYTVCWGYATNSSRKSSKVLFKITTCITNGKYIHSLGLFNINPNPIHHI